MPAQGIKADDLGNAVDVFGEIDLCFRSQPVADSETCESLQHPRAVWPSGCVYNLPMVKRWLDLTR